MSEKKGFQNFKLSKVSKLDNYLATIAPSATDRTGKAKVSRAKKAILDFIDYVEKSGATTATESDFNAWFDSYCGKYSSDQAKKAGRYLRGFSCFVSGDLTTAIISEPPVTQNEACPKWGELMTQYFNSRCMLENSRYIYQQEITRFFRDVTNNFGTLLPKEEHLEWWLAENLKTVSPSTTSLRITAVRGFFRWLKAKKIYKLNVDTITVPKRRYNGHKRDIVPVEKIREILERTKESKHREDFPIFMLLFFCGLRACEIVRANVGDLETAEPFNLLRVLRKNRDDKSEFITLPTKVSEALLEWLNYRREHSETLVDSEPLFPGYSKNSRLSVRTLECKANAYFNRVGLREVFGTSRITLHSCRHSAITYALASGCDVLEVQEMAGHRNINTTLIYAHSLNKRKNKASSGALDFVMNENNK